MRSTFERIKRTFLPSLDALDPRITPSSFGGASAMTLQEETPATKDGSHTIVAEASHASTTREARLDRHGLQGRLSARGGGIISKGASLAAVSGPSLPSTGAAGTNTSTTTTVIGTLTSSSQGPIGTASSSGGLPIASSLSDPSEPYLTSATSSTSELPVYVPAAVVGMHAASLGGGITTPVPTVAPNATGSSVLHGSASYSGPHCLDHSTRFFCYGSDLLWS